MKSKAGEGSPVLSNECANLLVQLKKAQSEFGCVPEKFLTKLARSLNISISEAYGVATFYSFLSTRALGRNVIRVCKSLPCYLKHSRMIIQCVEDELGIKPGETTPDGRFSLELTNCIGACDKAPAILINHDIHTSLTTKKLPQILKGHE